MNLFLNSISVNVYQRLQRRPVQSAFLTRMVMYSWFMVCLMVVLGCQNRVTTFDSFDRQQWILESTNCNDYRISVIDKMASEFDLLIGMNETELIVHLGKPEETHLYTRGQKFFSYWLTCSDSSDHKKKLRIRFSALDQVNEVLVLD